ncbi:tripartite tricarboxylate transporter TctB family protein [Falsiroseomonas oryzae]|uniref:tripartite tricarboxylate transporter TctB family protein n=1 Tax=Falsiroseomonas oryzae TaxID=2766473 RepID=UPI0022EACDFA|nr:tripartite tricarboxylate transporter TctB family protein [Roseomonas sp. MO-31]
MQHIGGRDMPRAVQAPDGAAAGAATAEAFVPERRAVAGVSVRTMEIATSLCFAAAGAAAIWDSARLGAGWGADGPQSGYFPFWIGLLLVLAAAANLLPLARAARARGEDSGGPDAPAMFLTWEQARTVATVFIPTTIYVAAIPFTGIYVASAVLVAWFMARLGEFSVWRAVPSGIATALVAFVVFEIWFLVALPKGPLEEFLGY